MKTVYLSGPITGCSFEGCYDWRHYVADQLADSSIHTLSPLRGYEDDLKDQTSITGKHKELKNHKNPLLTAQAINARDLHDCMTCDAMLVNVLDATKVSVGTIIEIGWVSFQNKPIILVGCEGEEMYDHIMVQENCQFKTDELGEAIYLLSSILF